MARNLTKKQRKFVNEYASGTNGVQAALVSYDTTDYGVANAIASENLQKPAIINELKELGFDSNNAKRVVAQILNDEEEDSQHRLNAADKVFKVNSDYAPDKTINLNIESAVSDEVKELTEKLNELYRTKSVEVSEDSFS